MGNIINNLTWVLSKLPNPTSKVSHFIGTCAQSPIARPGLSHIQNIITAVGRQKSSFLGKLKVTMKPLGTFLWKNFYCRLCNVLKKIGLFSSFSSALLKEEIIDEETIILPKAQKALICHLPKLSFCDPFNEEQALPLQLEAPSLQKALICHLPKLSFYDPINEEALPLESPAFQKAQISYLPFPTIYEESTLSTLFEKPLVTKEEFFNAASELFGKDLIERIQSWKKVSLPEILTQNDLLHALAIIGHGVTVGDLALLLTRINEGKFPLKLSKKAENLSQLSTQDIKKLIGFFRNPLEHLLPGEGKILYKELETSKHPIDSKRAAYTKYEYHIHKLAEEAKNLTKEEEKLLPFAISEQMAKFVGYAKPDTICKDMVIPIFTKEQGLSYYRLHDHINEEGLHCYLFTPLNNPNLAAQLVFRGTDGIASIKRDILDPNGIGKTAFDSYKEKIAEMVNSYCESTTKPALSICGHSLGAIDAQRATAFCVELYQEKTKHPHISKLSHISCSAFCSPKLDPLTIELWETEIHKLESSTLKLQLNFAYHENDLVTWGGHKNLSIPEELATHTNLQATYLHVSSDSGFQATNTHHRVPFFKGATFDSNTDNRKYDFYTNTKYAELKAKQAELNALKSEAPVFLTTEKDTNNNESIELVNSLEQINATLNSIKNVPDVNESFVMLDFGETEQALQTIESSLYEACLLKEKIKNHQVGFSSKDSWLIYCLEKALTLPTQRTLSYFT